MSNYQGYKLSDNVRRKKNNTGESLGWGPNTNLKSYSTKPGQLSMKGQVECMDLKYKAINKTMKVVKLSDLVCPIEKFYFLKSRGL